MTINFGANGSPSQADAAPKKRKVQTARRGGIQPSVPHAALPQKAAQPAYSAPTPSGSQRQFATKQTAKRGGRTPSFPRTIPQLDMESPPPYSEVADGHLSIAKSSLEINSSTEEPKTKNKSTGKVQPKVKKEPATRKPPKIKKEKAIRQEDVPSQSNSTPRLGLINGVYDITCPEIEGNRDCDELTLTLTLDSPGVWGAYDFGMFSGIMYIADQPRVAPTNDIALQWRGRENGEGEMSFGESCDGEISFLGHGHLEGWISLYGNCHSQGRRRDGPGTAIRSAKSMRDEWEEYNEDAYEHERRARWGGW